MGEDRRSHDDKLARIMRTAAGIFAEKGFHQASIRDISRATDISLAGLYHYFRSKEELLFRIQEHCFETVVQRAEQRLADVQGPEPRLRAFVENHLCFFVSNMKEMKVLSHEGETLSGAYREQVDARKRRYTALCAAIMLELKPDASPAEARAAAFALFGMMNWIYNWYQPARDGGVAELADRMSQLFLFGCLAVPAGGQDVERTDAGMTHSIWRH
jgi:TetR/AcrR family transcriptional regulator, cholesterol catabolism regulator